MNTNTQSQGPSAYSKVQKEVKKEQNKPVKILRPRQKPEWVEMYSSDEDIFDEKEPEEKKELITEFSSENAFAEKKQANLKNIKDNLEKININENQKIFENTEEQIANKELDINEKYLKGKAAEIELDFEAQKDIIDANNNIKPKRKIHISVVVDNKKLEMENKSEKEDLKIFQKPEDFLKRKIFEDADTNDDEIFKDLLNTENLKKKIVEEENRKRIEDEKKKKRQMEELNKNAKDEEVKMDSGDDDIFANAGEDVKIDINKKLIEKYENKIKQKRLNEMSNSSDNVIRNEKKRKELEKKYLSKNSLPNKAAKSGSSSPDNSQSHSSASESEDLFRPIFKDKESRITIKDQISREAQESKILEIEEKLKAQRKQDTKKLVIHYIKEDLSNQTVYDKAENLEMPNDSDDPDDLGEYEQWKIRELNRIKKQAQEDELKLKEKLEIERRRNLSDAQRKEENLRLGSDDTLRPFKSKLRFLQKYYHKGAFFSNERSENMEHVLNRDYNLPTWEDKVDRSGLPMILQKRRGLQFKKGQTKYTHLTAEDTTNFDPNFKLPENIQSKVLESMGGLKDKDKFEFRGEFKSKGAKK